MIIHHTRCDKLTFTWMLTREVFCSIVFDFAYVRRFAVAKPPYELLTYTIELLLNGRMQYAPTVFVTSVDAQAPLLSLVTY